MWNKKLFLVHLYPSQSDFDSYLDLYTKSFIQMSAKFPKIH